MPDRLFFLCGCGGEGEMPCIDLFTSTPCHFSSNSIKMTFTDETDRHWQSSVSTAAIALPATSECPGHYNFCNADFIVTYTSFRVGYHCLKSIYCYEKVLTPSSLRNDLGAVCTRRHFWMIIDKCTLPTRVSFL